MTDNELITILEKQKTAKAPQKLVYQAIDRGIANSLPKKRSQLRIWVTVVAALAVFLTVGLRTGKVQAFLNYFDFYSEFDYQRNVKENPAAAFTMSYGKDFTTATSKSASSQLAVVKPGYYDLTVTKGAVAKISIIGTISAKQQYRGFHFMPDNWLEMTSKDTDVLFEPAKFSKFELKNNQYVLDNILGSFAVGTELEAGTYQVEVQTNVAHYKVSVGTIDNVMEGTNGEGTKYESRLRDFTEKTAPKQEMILNPGSVFQITDHTDVHQTALPLVEKDIRVVLSKVTAKTTEE